MPDLLWIIPVLPLAGFLAIVVAGKRLAGRSAAFVGCLSVGLAMVASFIALSRFMAAPVPVPAKSFAWFNAGGLSPVFGLYLDGLSCTMAVVVAFVGFLIHLYSSGFMAGDEGYRRFFAYMNLFVGSMLVLVLADNLLLLYLGWEGVGLCSYLLIGFWYKDPANGRAAIKAFIVTRVGDAALAVGLFLIATRLGTFDIRAVATDAARLWPEGSAVATAACLLLLAGALAKSAQLPLQTWLPDAMAGPTPVSALIHAATMVTAGVYLIARMHPLFALAPGVLTAVGAIGAATLLYSGASALVQRDIKRVLAYSTISQVGYMFCALGVGAWSAAIFHFMTHAFFKALLFLSAGVVIKALDNEHDIFRMGGLRKGMPLAFWTFLAGAASLSALPLVTAGFYSKDLILSAAFEKNRWIWACGLAGAFLTSLYAFRAFFVVFFGSGPKAEAKPGASLSIPLVVLAVFAIGAGWLLPGRFAGSLFSGLFDALPGSVAHAPAITSIVTSFVSVAGIVAAALVYLALPRALAVMAARPAVAAVHRFLFSGWGFDRLYDRLFVGPFSWFARVNRGDAADLPYSAFAFICRAVSKGLVSTQSGKVRWYVTAVALGGAVFLAMVLL